MVTVIYKGVAVDSYHHKNGDLRVKGIQPANPSAQFNDVAVMQHVSAGSVFSPCISLTRSFGVARDYARSGPLPTAAKPGLVYEVHIPAKHGLTIVDPAQYILSKITNPLVSISYHHQGDSTFLDYVAYPRRYPSGPGQMPVPPGAGLMGAPAATQQYRTIINALRDSEILVAGNIPNTWVTACHNIDN